VTVDARNYRGTETLRNGCELCVRAARPDDVGRVIEAFEKLDAETIYLRFFGPKQAFSEADVERFRNIDFDKRVTLLGTVQENGREVVVAAGSYARTSNTEAEVAFVVEEDFHRLGIARRLLSHLGRIAEAAGIGRFTAEVLPQNTAMRGVFARCGWPMTSRLEDGTVHITLDLNSPARETAP
jgi:GNAT superfamily N-acetyltransferase